VRCDALVVDMQKFRMRFGFGVAAQLYVMRGLSFVLRAKVEAYESQGLHFIFT